MTTNATFKETAAAIRAELRHTHPETRFSVRMATGTASGWVDVFWTDGPSEATLRRVMTPFVSMTFDSLEDCQRPTGVTAWSCTGISYHRTYSKQLRKAARQLIGHNSDGDPIIRHPDTGQVYRSTYPYPEVDQVVGLYLHELDV